MRFVVVAFAIAAAVAAMPAWAGTVITSETQTPQSASGKSVVYLEADRARIESGDTVTIFRADQNVAYVVNPTEKKFMRMTPESMKKMASAMEAARAQMAEQMKSMPPDQRAQMEKMLAGAMPAQPQKIEFRKEGGATTVGKWQCEKVEQLADGKPQAQLCVARLSALGLGKGDLGVLQLLATFMQQAAPQSAGATAATDPQALEKIVGYPAFAVHMEVAAANLKTTTQSVEQKALPADLFEVPAGYQEETMPAPPR